MLLLLWSIDASVLASAGTATTSDDFAAAVPVAGAAAPISAVSIDEIPGPGTAHAPGRTAVTKLFSTPSSEPTVEVDVDATTYDADRIFSLFSMAGDDSWFLPPVVLDAPPAADADADGVGC